MEKFLITAIREISSICFYIPITFYIVKLFVVGYLCIKTKYISKEFNNFFNEGFKGLLEDIHCKNVYKFLVFFSILFIYGLVMESGIKKEIGSPFEPQHYTTENYVQISYDGYKYYKLPATIEKIDNMEKKESDLDSNYFISSIKLNGKYYEFYEGASPSTQLIINKECNIYDNDGVIKFKCILLKSKISINEPIFLSICLLLYLCFVFEAISHHKKSLLL